MDGLTLKQKLHRRLAALWTARSPWDGHAKEIATFVHPFRGRWLVSDKGGGKKHQRIINGTGTWALRTCASGLRAGTASPDMPWFRLKPEDPGLETFRPVKEWLELVMEVVYAIAARSNFYEEYHSSLYELIQFGTDALAHDIDRETVSHFTAWTFGSYAVANDERGRGSTVYRTFMISVENAARRWGKERLSPHARRALDQGHLDQQIEVVQAIEPVSDRWDRTAAARWEHATAYFERGSDGAELLEVGGFPGPRAHVTRWDVVQPDPYGFSPAMEALGDIKQMQLAERRKAQAIDNLAGQGAMQGPALVGGLLDRTPGSYNPVSGYGGANRITSLVDIPPSAVQVIAADIDGLEQRVNRAFYADLFLMLAMSDRRSITATEILERREEKILGLGPALTRLSTEKLSMVIETIFEDIVRASAPYWPDGGIVPPPPPELQEQDLKIEYVSSLFQALRQVQLGPLTQFVGLTDQLAQLQPEALDKRDADGLVDQFADLLGVSTQVYRSTEQANAIRQERQLAQQAREGAAAGLEMVDKLGGAQMEGTALGAAADMAGIPA